MARQMDGLMETNRQMDFSMYHIFIVISMKLAICAKRQMSPPPLTPLTQVTSYEVYTYYIY